jgi:hypothetical protein
MRTERGKTRHLRWRIMGIASLMLVTVPLPAQISNLSLNLQNTFYWNHIPQSGQSLHDRDYRQNYNLRLAGYGFNPGILSFTLASTLNDYASFKDPSASAATSRRRQAGLYQLRATVLRNSVFPIQVNAARKRYQHIRHLHDDVTTPLLNDAYDNETLGLSWRVPATPLTPQVNMTWNQSTVWKGEEKHQQINHYLFGMSNISRDGSSQYSIDYSRNQTGQADGQSTTSRDQLRFSSTARLKWNTTVNTNLSVNTVNDILTRNGRLGLKIIPGTKSHHDVYFNIEQSELPMSEATMTRFNHQSYLRIAQGVNIQFGTKYSSNLEKYDKWSTSKEEIDLNGLIRLNKQGRRARLMADLGGRVGYGARNETSSLVYQARSTLLATFRISPYFQVTCSDNISFDEQVITGPKINNSLRLRVLTTVIPKMMIENEFTRSDFHYLRNDLYLPPGMRNRSRVSMRLTRTMNSEVEYNVQWIDVENKFQRIYTTRYTLIESGYFRNTTFNLTGRTARNSYSDARDFSLTCRLATQFYAYRIIMNYTIRSLQSSPIERFYIEIHRPLSINFQ